MIRIIFSKNPIYYISSNLWYFVLKIILDNIAKNLLRNANMLKTIIVRIVIMDIC